MSEPTDAQIAEQEDLRLDAQIAEYMDEKERRDRQLEDNSVRNIDPLGVPIPMGFSIEERTRFIGVMDIAAEIAEVLIRKRRDYGSANLELTGAIGIASRIIDKTHRIWNLTLQDPDPAIDESIDDSYRDLVGYSLIHLYGQGDDTW